MEQQDDRRLLQLWQRRNWHWYLKKERRFDLKQVRSRAVMHVPVRRPASESCGPFMCDCTGRSARALGRGVPRRPPRVHSRWALHTGKRLEADRICVRWSQMPSICIFLIHDGPSFCEPDCEL